MAQPNMVREPSMDEILASIRRIIESNEPVTQASVATAMAEPEGFLGQPANDDSEEVTLTVDGAFADEDEDEMDARMGSMPVTHAVAEPRMRVEAPVAQDIRQSAFQQPTSPAPQKALSLADVAARVRAASERSYGTREPVFAQPAAVERPLAVEKPAPRIVAEAAPAFEATTVAVEEPEQEAVHHVEAHFEAETYVEPVAEVAVSSEPEALEPEPAPVSLLSSSVGEQVARSFQDLAFAVDKAERRSLDQIAEEMLRPMLQEWLDDNLPTMVERLVREEIERVARGPRR